MTTRAEYEESIGWDVHKDGPDRLPPPPCEFCHQPSSPSDPCACARTIAEEELIAWEHDTEGDSFEFLGGVRR